MPFQNPLPPVGRATRDSVRAKTLAKLMPNMKKKLPSRITVEGLDRAPHRAFLRALGLKAADLKQPFVGVASTDGRVTPCNALLGGFAREACDAIRAAGGTPFDFASISVADSMSINHGGMRYSLVPRGIIADRGQARAGRPGPHPLG